MLLAGDIGGTKTILAVYSPEQGPRKPLAEVSFPSAEYDNLDEILSEFLDKQQMPVKWACFGVAGPVVKGKARLSNLPWIIEKAKLENDFGFSSVYLLNDLEAIAYSVPMLESEDVLTIKEGKAVLHGNIAVIAPGTGLGEAFLTWDENRYQAHASEGGHADYAPRNTFQIGMLEYLLNQFPHVSYERVCSGSGIPNIYTYIKAKGLADEPPWLTEQLSKSSDPTRIIMRAAGQDEKTCRICQMTIETFVSILAAEAGNTALQVIATGGIFLGGGIPPRIIPYLQKPAFIEDFLNKGRLSNILKEVFVRVILHPKPALLGAACHGLERISEIQESEPSGDRAFSR